MQRHKPELPPVEDAPPEQPRPPPPKPRPQNPPAPQAAAAAAAPPVAVPDHVANGPIAVIVLGMAGSGKTTFMQQLLVQANAASKRAYTINLDPAVGPLPFACNIDIRDTVKYKEVMKHYSLGPNGGIVTSLNLFASRFDQVLQILDKRKAAVDYVFIDTPGQIEIFTWSASGTIITEAIAGTMPTCIVYLVDTPRTSSPVHFMSNMIHACSVLYKSKLPFVVCFNKIDVKPHAFALEWLRDYDAFREAADAGNTYSHTFVRSCSLMLEEFYAHMNVCGVSAMTGDGFNDLFQQLQLCKAEFHNVFLPEVAARKAAAAAEAASSSRAVLEHAKSLGRAGGGDFSSEVIRGGAVKGMDLDFDAADGFSDDSDRASGDSSDEEGDDSQASFDLEHLRSMLPPGAGGGK